MKVCRQVVQRCHLRRRSGRRGPAPHVSQLLKVPWRLLHSLQKLLIAVRQPGLSFNGDAELNPQVNERSAQPLLC